VELVSWQGGELKARPPAVFNSTLFLPTNTENLSTTLLSHCSLLELAGPLLLLVLTAYRFYARTRPNGWSSLFAISAPADTVYMYGAHTCISLTLVREYSGRHDNSYKPSEGRR
jgi:hypothetical protein